MDDDQIGFDIEFDDQTQAFLDWVAPERMDSEVQAFLVKAAPAIGDDSEWWNPPLSTQIMEAAQGMFGTWVGFVADENRALADGFVRFLGECYRRRYSDATWTNRPDTGSPLYAEFGPAINIGDSGGKDLVPEAKLLFRENYGPRMVEYTLSNARRKAW